jgi:hypothetical protein
MNRIEFVIREKLPDADVTVHPEPETGKKQGLDHE